MSFDDVTIHYEEAGAGHFAYVMCHGLGGNGHGFVEEFPFWREHFDRVVSWDARGIGRSSQAAKYSLPLYAKDLARLLEGLEIERAVIYGISWGGIVTQQFALDHPDKCAAIIVDSSSSETNLAASEFWYSRGEIAKGRAEAHPVEARTAFEEHDPQPQGQLGTPAIKPEHLDSYVAMARVAAGLREHPLTPRLKALNCPALIVGGGQDPVAGVGGSVIMSRNLPNARLEVFRDVGHGVARYKRDEFRALVLEFCRDHDII